MYLLNYLYFFIITFWGIKFLFQRNGAVGHPLNNNQKLKFDGPELFWTLTFSTGLLAFSAPGRFDLMAIRLLVLEVLCLIGLFVVKRQAVWSAATILYLFYIIWLIIGLSYSPAPGYGFRVILKYLFPFLVMLFASAAVRHKEVFLKAGLGARIVAVISISFSFIPLINHLIPGVFWTGTARAIHYISMCVFSLALFYYGGRSKKDLCFFVLFILPCVLWVFRTSIMGTTFALMTFFFFRYKMKSLPVIGGVFILFVLSVFFIPNIKNKMFYNGEEKNIQQLQAGNLSIDDINSNGRFTMWKFLQRRMYKDREIIGSGTGSVQNYMYSNFVFGGLKVPHNDYVQMLCDNGLVGIIVYFMMIGSFVVHCFIKHNNRKNDIAVRLCAIVAGSSLVGVVLTMYTDNVVNYSMATLTCPFGFYGMMLGLSKR